MAQTYELIDYYYVQAKRNEVPRILETLRREGIDLYALHAFPEGKKVQIDVSPKDARSLTALAHREKWKLTGPKKAFAMTSDEDRPGIVADLYESLEKQEIEVTAASAIACDGCCHALFWVPEEEVMAAAKVLDATPHEEEEIPAESTETPPPS